MEFFELKVRAIRPETTDTSTIELEVPESLKDKFSYRQGQYITLRTEQDGKELRRSYSMSSSPLDNKLAITVKKVKGGRVSTWLVDEVKEGDTLNVATPEGRFYSEVNPDKRRTYYMFGAGSGITPLMSIIRTVLEAEPMSAVFLLYGNRDEENIIFRDELDALSKRYDGQLHVEYVLSQPKKESSGGLFGLFRKSSSNWQGKTGRITAKVANQFLDEQMARGPEQDCVYFICGPGFMADDIRNAIISRGISSKQVHTEHFVNAGHTPGEFVAGAAGGEKKAIIHLRGEKHEFMVPDGGTILDVLVKAKLDPPYSCTSGACATCMGKVLSGKVVMDACYALDESEIKSGYILTCQSRPDSDVVEVTYDL